MNRFYPTTWLRSAPATFELDRIFQEFWNTTAPLTGGTAFANGEPALNVHETPEAFEIEMELPGLALADIDVTLEGRDLTIRGERKTALQDGATWQRRERFHGSFSRTLHFGVDLDPARVQASLALGVLTVRLAKAETVKARRIPVSAQAADRNTN